MNGPGYSGKSAMEVGEVLAEFEESDAEWLARQNAAELDADYYKHEDDGDE